MSQDPVGQRLIHAADFGDGCKVELGHMVGFQVGGPEAPNTGPSSGTAESWPGRGTSDSRYKHSYSGKRGFFSGEGYLLIFTWEVAFFKGRKTGGVERRLRVEDGVREDSEQYENCF